MECLYCGGDTKVINSRHQKRRNSVWRRRLCLNCDTVFTSVEAIDYNGSIVVRKKDGKKDAVEPFSRDRLLLSLHDSLQHRKSAHADASALTGTVLSRLHVQITEAELTPEQIKFTVLEALAKFDKAAATHYKAFHK